MIAEFELRIGASSMNREDLEERTKKFALQIIRFVSALPKNMVTNVLAHQLLKSGTSIGANYREASRGESRGDFIHKIAIAEKEAAETEYWLELFKEEGIGDADRLRWLTKESQELLAILTASGKTAKKGRE
ncbi:four helix bundle protein [Candidatus Bipolaricaulota bacterium]